jgi:hypothetical protein
LGLAVQNFIRSENIKLYRKALTHTTDSDQRRVISILLRLLVVEEIAQAPRPNNIAQID